MYVCLYLYDCICMIIPCDCTLCLYLYDCTVLSGVDGPGPGLYHTPQSSAEVKESVELYLYSFLRFW